MGGAFQMRFYRVFMRRLHELRDADAAEEEGIEYAAKKMAKVLQSDLEKFEKRHSRPGSFANPTPASQPSTPSTSRLLHEGTQENPPRYRWSPFYSRASMANRESQPMSTPNLDFTLPK
jgi:hypothetical protein